MRLSPARPTTGGPVYYGWAIVTGVFVILMFAAGLGFYNATVYLQALVEERGIPLTAASGATAVFFVSGGLAGLPISAMLRRYDPRQVVVVGAFTGAAALWLLGAVTEVVGLYLVYALFGIGFASVTLVPATTLVTGWFQRRRALALAIATTGLSAGGIVVTPVTSGMIADQGLAAVTPLLGALWLVGIAPVALLLLRRAPSSDPATHPDADPAEAGSDDPGGGMAWRPAVRSAYFRGISVTFLLLLLVQVGLLAHLFPLTIDQVGRSVAPLAVSTVAFSSIVGRILGAAILQRVAPGTFTWVLGLLQAAATVVLATTTDTAALLAAVAIFGLTVGNVLVLTPLVLVSAFGMRDYSTIFSVNQLIGTLGIASGPIVFGALREATGGYTTPLVIAAVASVVAALVIGRSREPTSRVAAQA